MEGLFDIKEIGVLNNDPESILIIDATLQSLLKESENEVLILEPAETSCSGITAFEMNKDLKCSYKLCNYLSEELQTIDALANDSVGLIPIQLQQTKVSDIERLMKWINKVGAKVEGYILVESDS